MENSELSTQLCGDSGEQFSVEKSERGTNLASYKGHLYHFHRQGKEVATWRCSKYSTTNIKCRSLLKTQGDRVIEFNEHSHFQNPIETKTKKFMSNLKAAAKSSAESTSRLIGSQLSSVPSSLKPHLPTVDSLSRFVRENRQVRVEKLVVPRTLPDLEDIPSQFQRMKCGAQFLQHDSGVESGNSRFLIFGTTDSIQWLEGCSSIFVDATFKAAPAIFSQLLVIIGFQDNRAFPCLFVLMPSKTQSAYDIAWKTVQELCPNLRPDYIMTDFESASINSLRKAFRTSQQKGCYFHFTQCVVRKCQGLASVWAQYLEDPDYSLEIRKLLSLAFVPPASVTQYFDDLMNTPFFDCAYSEETMEEWTEETKSLNELLVYFETTWIRRYVRSRPRNALFLVDLWNCYDSTRNGWARTNNYCESFNNTFNSILCASHPTLWKFIEDLKVKHEVTRKNISDYRTGQLMTPKKKMKYTNYNERLLTIIETFGTIGPMEYLTNLAQVIVPK